jgi:hypothetical protein
MVADKIFGWDCIGFVANYMIFIGLWPKYLGYPIDSWSGVFPTRVLSPADVKTLCIMIWPGSHIAIIDRVWDYDEGKVTVDVCQSSSGGPKCNVKVKLTKSGDGFQISGGDPPMPVAGRCLVWRKRDLSFATG